MTFKAGIDLDGVVYDVLGATVTYLNDIYDLNVKPEDITQYYIEEYLDGITKEQVVAMYKNPGIYVGRSPLPHSIVCINKLRESGWWVDIVTARDWDCLPVTLDWMYEMGLEVDRLSFMTSAEKIRYSEEEEFDIFVEDKYDTIKSLEDIVPLTYLINQPYNQTPSGEGGTNKFLRVNDLRGVLKSLRERGMYDES